MSASIQPQVDDWKVHQLLAPISSTDTTHTSAVINRQVSHGGALTVVWGVGTMAASGVVTISLTESDTFGGSFTAVATADYVVAPVTFVAASDAGKYQALHYKGSKAFIKAVTVTSGTAACLVGCYAIENRGKKPAGVSGKVATTV